MNDAAWALHPRVCDLGATEGGQQEENKSVHEVMDQVRCHWQREDWATAGSGRPEWGG